MGQIYGGTERCVYPTGIRWGGGRCRKKARVGVACRAHYGMAIPVPKQLAEPTPAKEEAEPKTGFFAKLRNRWQRKGRKGPDNPVRGNIG